MQPVAIYVNAQYNCLQFPFHRIEVYGMNLLHSIVAMNQSYYVKLQILNYFPHSFIIIYRKKGAKGKKYAN